MLPWEEVLFGLHCVRINIALDGFLSNFLKLSHHLESIFNFPSGSTPELQITDEPEVNARARWDESSSIYSIEFTLGMIVWLDGVAATLASYVSRDFADAPHPPLILDPNEKDWRSLYQQRLDLSTAHLPEEYFGAWESFFQKAAVAIFAHEFAHVARGHLDWSKAKSGIGTISERSLRKAGTLINVNQTRALEFEADMFAARMIAYLATEPPEFLPRWRVGTATETLVESLLGLTLFFVSVEAEDKGTGSSAPDYPRPLLRMIVMLSYMEPVWSRAHPKGDFWQDVFGGALSVLALIENLYPEIDLLRLLNETDINAAIKDEANEISDHLENLQRETLGYAFESKGLWQFDIE